MSSEISSSCDSPAPKKPRTMDDQAEVDISSGDSCRNAPFSDFQVIKVLNENSQRKMMCLHGKFKDSDQDAVVILEKTPLSEETTKDILTRDTEAKGILQNDIYSTYELQPDPRLNGIKSTLIYPATQKHITKYSTQELYLVSESPEDYEKITLPHIMAEGFSMQWVYNILEKKKESERIVYEDTDKETGFVLLPDMKWDGSQVEDLYLVAIIHRHGLKSLRDLTTEHIPLLSNILNKGMSAIKEKYGVGSSKLRIYLHYQPSYYHLHVHFTHLRYDAPGSGAEKAHLLSDVIDNITLDGQFYQKKTLTFAVRENEGLCKKYKEAGKL